MFEAGQRVKLNEKGSAAKAKAMFNWTGIVIGPGINERWVKVDWDGAPSQNWHELKEHLMEIGVNEIDDGLSASK